MAGFNNTLRIIFFVIVQAIVVQLRAQDYKFNHFSVEQGLSQTVVNCIMQDQQGFMWFGTQEGLNRYDGYAFKIYKRDPQDSNSLANNFIYTIYQTKDGIIWIGTNGNGLDRFDPISESFTHYPYDENNPASISSNSIRIIHEDASGNLWVGTDDGLNLFDRSTKKFTRFLNNPNDPHSLPANRIFDIKEDKAGSLWIATYGKGLCKYDPVSRRFESYLMTDADINRLYPKVIQDDQRRRTQCNLTRSLYFFDETHLWVGNDGCGVGIFNTATLSFEKIMYPESANGYEGEMRIFAMCEDSYDNLWLAIYDASLDIKSKSTGVAQHYIPNDRDPYAFASDQPKCIYRDRAGNMWCGTSGKGVQVYFKSTSTISHIRRSERPGVGNNTMMSSAILSVMEDSKGLLWIGTDGGGVTTYNSQTGLYTQHPELSPAVNNGVLCLLESKDGSIWSGTYGEGVVRRRPDGTIRAYTPAKELENGTILTIAEDPKDGSIWFGTFGAGMYHLDPVTDSLLQFTSENSGLPSDIIYNLYFDKQGTLWIGTRGGGAVSRDSKGMMKVYHHDDKVPNSLSNDLVYCINEDLQGNIWISTANGLNLLNRQTDTFTAYYERNGLPSDNIYAVVPDDEGYLWLSHNKGLTRFKANPTGTEKQFVNYGPAAGVQPAEFNQGAYGRNKKGLLFFGGQKGLNIIDVTKLKSNASIAPVYVTSYKRFGTEIVLDSAITSKRFISVTWRENYFMFEATILDFVDPQKNVYQYKLEGFDDDWSPVTTNRYISYTNLPGGNYTLRIRGADSNGNWNEEGVSLQIFVQPPWWKTTWFYTICVITVIGGVIGFTRYRTSAIKKENRILEARVAERTHELAQKNADITASIQYAKRIQGAVLPELDFIYRHLPQSFVFYRPKDIVSGDFYWFAEKDGHKIMICADCTGHGVPGALMSVIGHNLLNQIVLEKGVTSPEEILNRLNKGVMAALKQGQHGEEDTRDGMDIAICVFTEGSRELKFAGALRPLVVVRKNGTLEKVDSDRFPIGGNFTGKETDFKLHKVQLEPGDMLYMFSDGFADQFGGPRGKKFMVKNLLELLLKSSDLPLSDQAAKLEETFDAWKDNYAQVDDVLVVGIRV
jgi:ligand-binding sensor domain-containing protein/serine phosphatase RsbU (regulator of sigma subunit)